MVCDDVQFTTMYSAPCYELDYRITTPGPNAHRFQALSAFQDSPLATLDPPSTRLRYSLDAPYTLSTMFCNQSSHTRQRKGASGCQTHVLSRQCGRAVGSITPHDARLRCRLDCFSRVVASLPTLSHPTQHWQITLRVSPPSAR